MVIENIKRILFYVRYLRNMYSDQQMKREISKRFHCVIDTQARIAVDNLNNIQLGKGVYIGAFTICRVGNDPLAKNVTSSRLEIGESTYIGELNNIRAGGGTIKIGKKCQISQHVSIIASNHGIKKGIFIQDQPWSVDKTDVEIGDDVWIGCGAQILPGTIIGSGAVIGAGSLVNKDVPENAVVGGNPAKIIRFRT